MIYHLTFFLIALLGVKSDVIVVFSEKNLAIEAGRRCDRNYCLFDAHDGITKITKVKIENRIKEIYRKSGTKVFIFVTRAIKIYSDFFLHNLMEMIGKKYDNDAYAKDYIGLIFTERNHERVYYRYGKNINNGKDIDLIIKSFSKKIRSLGIGNAIVNMVYTMKPQRFKEQSTVNKTYEEDELIAAIKKNEKIIFDPEGYVNHKYMEEINEYLKLMYNNRHIRVHFVYIYGMKSKYSPDSLFVSIEKVLQQKYPGKSILFFYDYSKNLMKYEIKGTKHTAYINSYIEDYKKKYLNNDLGAFTLESLKKIYPNA
jgi:hypothetical protein